jgi:hypothetical protein
VVYAGLEGPVNGKEAGGSAGKRMADWCALGGWQKSCRIRVFSYIVSGLDGIESNHGPTALVFWGFRAGSKALGNNPAVIITLELIEVWRDVRAGACVNHIQSHHCFRLRRSCMSFALLSCYEHSDVRIVVTASPVSLAHDFSTMDVVIAKVYTSLEQSRRNGC